MANQSTNLSWTSPDYFKLFDDFSGYNSRANGPLNSNRVGNTANSFNFGSFDFYGNSLTNSIGSNNSGTIISTASSPSSAPSSGAHSLVNQTFQYQYDYGGDGRNNMAQVNESVKPNYESGSNFMLLMEDFSAYFYNYNGSVGTGIGTTGSTAININNTTGIEFQANCSIANGTCADSIGKTIMNIILIGPFSSFFFNYFYDFLNYQLFTFTIHCAFYMEFSSSSFWLLFSHFSSSPRV